MIDHRKLGSLFRSVFGPIILILTVALAATLAFSHGPKGHNSGEFTAFMAVKKGVELYDRMVIGGKLAESWEIDLSNLEVFVQTNGTEEEFVVKFNRSKGEPKSVYIFLSSKGEYRGSNFSGE
jgi:hypothetical protein